MQLLLGRRAYGDWVATGLVDGEPWLVESCASGDALEVSEFDRPVLAKELDFAEKAELVAAQATIAKMETATKAIVKLAEASNQLLGDEVAVAQARVAELEDKLEAERLAPHPHAGPDYDGCGKHVDSPKPLLVNAPEVAPPPATCGCAPPRFLWRETKPFWHDKKGERLSLPLLDDANKAFNCPDCHYTLHANGMVFPLAPRPLAEGLSLPDAVKMLRWRGPGFCMARPGDIGYLILSSSGEGGGYLCWDHVPDHGTSITAVLLTADDWEVWAVEAWAEKCKREEAKP